MAQQEENVNNQQPEQTVEEQTIPETAVPTSEPKTQPDQSASPLNPVFPSAPLLLDCAKDEYTKERERTQFLDNKASFFMSAIILVATIFVPFIPFDKVREAVTGGSDAQKAATYVAGTLVLVSFVVLVLAFKKLYDAYKIKGYERFDINNIVDMGNLVIERNAMEKALCQNYKETIDKNIKSNDDKALNVSDGIGKCAIGFLILAVSAIILKVFIG